MNGLRLLKEAQVWECRGKIILTDPSTRCREDSVFPICIENVAFCELLDVKDGDSVLDLCTGSGVIALEAAEKAREVLGVDVNVRAIEFARFNAQINALAEKTKFCVGKLFAPVKGRVFDKITANPPFEPVPDGWRYFSHSHGGVSGLEIVGEICSCVRGFLRPDGMFQMVTYSPEPKSENWHGVLRASFGSVIIQKIQSLDAEKFETDVARRLSKLNPGRVVPRIRVPKDLALWFVKALC